MFFNKGHKIKLCECACAGASDCVGRACWRLCQQGGGYILQKERRTSPSASLDHWLPSKKSSPLHPQSCKLELTYINQPLHISVQGALVTSSFEHTSCFVAHQLVHIFASVQTQVLGAWITSSLMATILSLVAYQLTRKALMPQTPEELQVCIVAFMIHDLSERDSTQHHTCLDNK